jgi:predicted RNA-binding protein YlqC (UPF0109 family)
MDKKWRPAQRNSRQPFKKGRNGRGLNDRPRVFIDESKNPQAAEDLVEYIVKVLARDAEMVNFTKDQSDDRRLRFIVKCDPSVAGRLIGKGGKTITNLREFAKLVAARSGKKIDIDISSTEDGEQSEHHYDEDALGLGGEEHLEYDDNAVE